MPAPDVNISAHSRPLGRQLPNGKGKREGSEEGGSDQCKPHLEAGRQKSGKAEKSSDSRSTLNFLSRLLTLFQLFGNELAHHLLASQPKGQSQGQTGRSAQDNKGRGDAHG